MTAHRRDLEEATGAEARHHRLRRPPDRAAPARAS